MAANEKTSGRLATLASKILKGMTPTPKQAKSLAASVLTQAADKDEKGSKRNPQ